MGQRDQDQGFPGESEACVRRDSTTDAPVSEGGRGGVCCSYGRARARCRVWRILGPMDNDSLVPRNRIISTWWTSPRVTRSCTGEPRAPTRAQRWPMRRSWGWRRSRRCAWSADRFDLPPSAVPWRPLSPVLPSPFSVARVSSIRCIRLTRSGSYGLAGSKVIEVLPLRFFRVRKMILDHTPWPRGVAPGI